MLLSIIWVIADKYSDVSFKYHAERGTPLYISNLEKGKIYVRPDGHPNIVPFLVEGETDEKVIKVAFLPENCPKRFTVIDENGLTRVVSVPILPVSATKG